jgi:hypothetical protein
MSKQAKPEYKLFVGVLCNQAFVPTPFAQSLSQMALPRGTIVEFVGGRTIDAMRNRICDIALEGDYTHCCMLDSDMVYQPFTFWELLKADKDIIAGLSVTRLPPPRPVFMQPIEEDEWQFLMEWPPGVEGVHECGAIGGAALMLKRDTLRLLPRPWFRSDQVNAKGLPVSEDVYFCTVARKRGLEVHCHTKVRPQHLVEHGYVPTVKDGHWEVDAVHVAR